jgi:predicted alpha/beta-hydrolase family hydrolase
MMKQDVAFLLAPGAGAPSAHPRMQIFRNILAPMGEVESFDYAYARAGRKTPDRLPKLIETHRAALSALREKHPRRKIVLVGKSMGGRVGCHVALEEKVDAVICLGYPLCGAGDATKLRDEVLLALRAPILFVQGTKDRLCPLDLLTRVYERMSAPGAIHVVADGDHSLVLAKTALKAQGVSQADVDATIGAAIGEFLSIALNAP